MFEPINVFNNWENLEYSLGKKRVKSGDKLTLRWPNGVEEPVVLIGRAKSFTVSDHGHVYSGVTEELYFEAEVNGVKVLIKVGDKKILFEAS